MIPPPPPPTLSANKPITYKEKQEQERKSALTVRERRWEDIYPLHAAAQRGDEGQVNYLRKIRDPNQQVRA
jgi:hypothetical protein